MLLIKDLQTSLLDIPLLEVAAGECVAVMGPSGAGKSLLLRAIADLDPNTADISFDGISREQFAPCDWRRRISLIPAESGWWADIVGDHFSTDLPADALLTELNLPSDILGWPVSRLSSGERHRLAIARSLALCPKVLLLDEPTAALDADAIQRVEALLTRQREAGVALLLITHDANQAGRMASRTLHIAGGRLTDAREATL